ncbi:MAG: hypothetical protein CM15mV50_190 [uncultured marine virus]|nr:MAG: hypothetical protein CM15mV50_190 [uncultured marine virus]
MGLHLEEVVEAKENGKKKGFVYVLENGWAMEVKVEGSAEEAGEPVRARNKKRAISRR